MALNECVACGTEVSMDAEECHICGLRLRSGKVAEDIDVRRWRQLADEADADAATMWTGRPRFQWLYLSLRGRLSRSTYLRYVMLPALLGLVVGATLVNRGGNAADSAGFAFAASFWIISFGLAKRLQDMDCSAWVVRGVWVVMAVGVLNTVISAFTGSEAILDLGAFLWLIVGLPLFVLLLVSAVVALFFPGTVGRNRYGPDPCRNRQ